MSTLLELCLVHQFVKRLSSDCDADLYCPDSSEDVTLRNVKTWQDDPDANKD
jgi:hypothetical protein